MPAAVANTAMLLVGASVLSLFFVLSLYMQQVLRYSPLKAGVTQLPLAGTIVLAAALAPALLGSLGHKTTLLARLTPFAAGLAWFSRIATHGSSSPTSSARPCSSPPVSASPSSYWVDVPTDPPRLLGWLTEAGAQ